MEIGFLMFLGIPILVLLLGAVLAGVAFGFSALLFKLFGRASRLDQLALLYPVENPPEGVLLKRQWMAIGPVYFKNTVDVCLSPQGLYLWVKPFLSKYKPVLIPWSELREPRKAILYWQQAARLTIGTPPITTMVIMHKLYWKMRPYLNVSDPWG